MTYFEVASDTITGNVQTTESVWGRIVRFRWRKTRVLEDIHATADKLLATQEKHELFWESPLPIGPMLVEQEMIVQPLASRRLYVAVRISGDWRCLFQVRAMTREVRSVSHSFGGPRAAFLPAPRDTDPN